MEVACQQIVISQTRDAGGMSWALMLHPNGLPISAYVSHSFDEGVYEFQRKVRGSMPQGSSTVWSRLFSIPHCQGDDYLLSSLGDEPLINSFYAVAIAHAELLLVVPNRTASTFLRSWCALEACIAFKKEITVVPAVDMFQCSRRTSIGSTSHAAANVTNSLPQAVGQLFQGFETVRQSSCADQAVNVRIKDALSGIEDWLDTQIRSELMGLI